MLALAKICARRLHCEMCRDREGGREWRTSLGQYFEVPEGAPDFDCPRGLAWGWRPQWTQRLRRWAAAAASLALPLLLMWRLACAVRCKDAIAVPAARALPFLLIFYMIWALGEAIGYIAGPGGALRSIE